MKNKAFFEFLTTKELPPVALRQAVGKDISLSFHLRSIVLRFLSFQLLGALFSMSFCPQFGLGLMDGHGVTHHLRMIGDWACASFCGSLFLSSGMLFAFMGMKAEELWWVWRRFKFSLIFLPALLWSCLMLLNVTLKLPAETPSYHLTWILMAILVQGLWLQVRSSTYARVNFYQSKKT
jgi:hypothetical protein